VSKPSIIGPSRAADIEFLQSLAYGYRLPISSLRIMRLRRKELYVSTSGFTKEARYKIDRANNQVSLIDCDELVNLIIHFYDSFDAEAGSLLPLQKIYGPE
jgi:predicted Mrr-cat superfamily restriction endonuclease